MDATGNRWTASGMPVPSIERLPIRSIEGTGIVVPGDPGQAYVDEHLPRLGWFDSRVPLYLTRADYEARCVVAGLSPLPDADLGLHSNEWMIDGSRGDDARVAVWSVLSGRRILGIQLERGVYVVSDDGKRLLAVQRPSAPANLVPCAVCGERISQELLLSSSMDGQVCPDCYDVLEATA